MNERRQTLMFYGSMALILMAAGIVYGAVIRPAGMEADAAREKAESAKRDVLAKVKPPSDPTLSDRVDATAVERQLDEARKGLEKLLGDARRVAFRMPAKFAPPSPENARLHFEGLLRQARADAVGSGVFLEAKCPLGFEEAMLDERVEGESVEELAVRLSERLAVAERVMEAAREGAKAGELKIVKVAHPVRVREIQRGEEGLSIHIEHVTVSIHLRCNEQSLIRFLQELAGVVGAEPRPFVALKGLSIEVKNPRDRTFEADLMLAGIFERTGALKARTESTGPLAPLSTSKYKQRGY